MKNNYIKYLITVGIFVILLAVIGFKIYRFSYIDSVNKGYADIAYKNYNLLYSKVKTFKYFYEGFKKTPSKQAFNKLKSHWKNIIIYYNRAEIFSNYEYFLPENHKFKLKNSKIINKKIGGYPINIEYIDYTVNDIYGGIINKKGVTITENLLLEESKKSNILGIHALEFLLWGEIFDKRLPGNRTWLDYKKSSSNKQRKEYFDIALNILLKDIEYLVDVWTPNSRFRNKVFTLKNSKEQYNKTIVSIINYLNDNLYEEKISKLLKKGKDMQENKFSNFKVSLQENINSLYYLYLGIFRKDEKGNKLQFKALVNISDKLDKKLTDSIISVFLQIRKNEKGITDIYLITKNKSFKKQKKKLLVELKKLKSNISKLRILLYKLKTKPNK